MCYLALYSADIELHERTKGMEALLAWKEWSTRLVDYDQDYRRLDLGKGVKGLCYLGELQREVVE
jgi:hypothetical protein